MNIRKISFILLAIFSLSILTFGCNRGNTDGGDAAESATEGSVFVSDGGAGGELRIELLSPTLPTGDRIGFRVFATDPTGGPLAFIRIFCESEHGIAIIEPSRGGVAFESTDANGQLSGVLGGVAPGSFILECRGPQGFNLIDRVTLIIVGDAPDGFSGFPGAAGGNLGGGVIVEPPASDVTITDITFTTVGGTNRNGPIDTFFVSDCDADPMTPDPETFGNDNFSLSISNGLAERVFIESVSFVVDDGRSVMSSEELGGLVILPDTEVSFLGSFTFVVFGTKFFAGTGLSPENGVFNVAFTVSGVTDGGDDFTVTQTASVVFMPIDGCGA